MDAAQILIDGTWRNAAAESTFHAFNPSTGEALAAEFPTSAWADVDIALDAATQAAGILRTLEPERIAAFLETYADNIEAGATAIVAAAHEETGLPATPRLKDVELPRTTNQLRQAATAVREENWKRATLDSAKNIRSCLASIGPVVVFGPNNFPFAFNGISGGDFAAAIAAGNPVVAKAHPLHPNTTRLLAEEARRAVQSAGLPGGTVQMLYNLSTETGLKLVGDARVGAIGFTGSRPGGMALKQAADAAGKPIYLEMSSINPVIFLPGALKEHGARLAQEITDSCLAGAGQFCTSPNLILAVAGPEADRLIQTIASNFNERVPQPLLSAGGRDQIGKGVSALVEAGARVVTGSKPVDGPAFRFQNTLLHVAGEHFLAHPHELQREVFGNATMLVTVRNLQELQSILTHLEGNLTGSVYSAQSGADDEAYSQIEPLLRQKVGRLLNDRMPTGVAVSPAMNHGGPFPATSHPGFTSVGIPAAITRFAALQCYDGVREDRLPPILRKTLSNPRTWRIIDGAYVNG